MENPREITILAVGPLTNIALAIRREPRFAAAVKRMVIMGGAIASLPNGGGNQTPKAEFNFWVDPEAAKIVLRAGIPITLSPLNVAARLGFNPRVAQEAVERRHSGDESHQRAARRQRRAHELSPHDVGTSLLRRR